MSDNSLNVKPGERVVIKPEAREAVGGAAGVVVGTRDVPPPGLVVAVDGKRAINSVVAPEDVERPDA